MKTGGLQKEPQELLVSFSSSLREFICQLLNGIFFFSFLNWGLNPGLSH